MTYPRYRRLTMSRRDRWDEKDPDPPFRRCLTWLVSLFRDSIFLATFFFYQPPFTVFVMILEKQGGWGMPGKG